MAAFNGLQISGQSSCFTVGANVHRLAEGAMEESTDDRHQATEWQVGMQ